MPTPRKLIAFLTLVLTLSSNFGFAADGDLGPGWTQSNSSGGVTVYIPTGDNPNGAINSGPLVLTQNGKEYYAPASGSIDKVSVDSTGRISRTLTEVTRVTRSDGSTYVYATPATFYTEAADAAKAMWDKVKDDPASFPSLSVVLSALPSTPASPASGVVVSISGANYQLTTPLSSECYWQGYSVPDGPKGTYKLNYNVYPATVVYTCGVTAANYPSTQQWKFVTTTNPPNANMTDFSSFSPESLSAAGQSEIDKLIYENPDSFNKSYTPSATTGLTDPPIPNPVSPEKIIDIYAGNGGPSGSGLPSVGSSGIPTLPGNVGIPQPDSGTGGSPGTDVYGPGYTPGFNNSPYGSSGPGGVEFGNRLSQFMTDLRGSSLFSLPTSILGNIPSSGTSAISFDGGQFGHQSFDFAAFSNQLMVIRSVLLLCFSLLSIRIVTLKR